MDLYNDKYIQIKLNQDNACMEYQWKRFVPDKAFRGLLDKIYDYTVEHKCDKMLVDMEKMRVIPVESQKWVESDWFPRMIGQGVKIFAMVMPKDKETTGSISKKEMDAMVQDQIKKSGVASVTFNDLDKAKEWIAQRT